MLGLHTQHNSSIKVENSGRIKDALSKIPAKEGNLHVISLEHLSYGLHFGYVALHVGQVLCCCDPILARHRCNFTFEILVLLILYYYYLNTKIVL